MGNCFSQSRENGSPPPSQVPSSGHMSDPHFQALASHRRIAHMNVYKDDSMGRKATLNSLSYFMPQESTLSSNNSRGHSNSQKVIALYNYESRVEGDISFKKDDIMVVLEET